MVWGVRASTWLDSMLGVGRFGGIAGSFLVAELSRRQFSLPGIFTVVASAGLIAAAALVIKQAGRKPVTASDDASKIESLAH